MTTVLLFENLVPKPKDGDIAPCRAVLETVGARGGREIPVLLMDRGVALQAARAGGWALEELSRALEHADQILLESAPDTAPIRSLLEKHGRSAESPEAYEPLRITSYGELTPALLLNGLVLTDHETSRLCTRPGVIAWRSLDAEALHARLMEHRALAKGSPPERALALHFVGGALLSDIALRSVVSEAVTLHGFRIGSLTFGGGAPLELFDALRFIVELQIRTGAREPAQLEIGGGADPDVMAVARAIEGPITLDTLERLNAAFRALAPSRTRATLLRRSDDGTRRASFHAIAQSRAAGSSEQESRALESAVAKLGPAEKWIRAYRQTTRSWRPRVVMIPTWQCELRCRYCRIPKQDGRVMPRATVDQGIDLLLSAEAKDLDLHFFGGEPLSEWELIQYTLETAHARARAEGRTIRFLFTTNGWTLSRERFDWLARFPVWFQLSLDGDSATQNEFRPAVSHGDSYALSPADKAVWFREAEIEHDVVQVVHPANIERMAQNFRHILELGYPRIQINYALGTHWETPAMEEFGRQLALVGAELEQRWQAGTRAEMVNLEETLLAVRGNLEVTVDWDGSVFGSTAFLVNTKHREDFKLGHLDDGASFDRYQCDGFAMEHLLDNWFSAEMAENNKRVGAVLVSFVRYMRRKHPWLETGGPATWQKTKSRAAGGRVAPAEPIR